MSEICGTLCSTHLPWPNKAAAMSFSAEFFAPDFDSWSFVNDYIQANPDCNPKIVNSRITDLKAIATRQLGCIVVAAECSIDEVTDIFIRLKINITHVNTQTVKNVARLRFGLEVTGTALLHQALKEILGVKGVISARRC